MRITYRILNEEHILIKTEGNRTIEFFYDEVRMINTKSSHTFTYKEEELLKSWWLDYFTIGENNNKPLEGTVNVKECGGCGNGFLPDRPILTICDSCCDDINIEIGNFF